MQKKGGYRLVDVVSFWVVASRVWGWMVDVACFLPVTTPSYFTELLLLYQYILTSLDNLRTLRNESSSVRRDKQSRRTQEKSFG
jgi:hypothetical protein